MANDGILPVLDNDAAERNLDVGTLTVGTVAVLRERMQGAGAGAAEVWDVKNALPGTAHYGLVVRQAPDTNGVTQFTGGNVAHDAADSGNPVKMGGKAKSALSAPVAASDRTDQMYDLFGRAVNMPYAPHADILGSVSPAMTASAAAATIIAAQGAGTAIYVSSLHAVNNGTVSTLVRVRSAATERFVLSAPANLGVAAPITFPVPLPLTANEPLTAVCDATPGGTVYVSVVAYKAG